MSAPVSIEGTIWETVFRLVLNGNWMNPDASMKIYVETSLQMDKPISYLLNDQFHGGWFHRCSANLKAPKNKSKTNQDILLLNVTIRRPPPSHMQSHPSRFLSGWLCRSIIDQAGILTCSLHPLLHWPHHFFFFWVGGCGTNWKDPWPMNWPISLVAKMAKTHFKSKSNHHQSSHIVHQKNSTAFHFSSKTIRRPPPSHMQSHPSRFLSGWLCRSIIDQAGILTCSLHPLLHWPPCSARMHFRQVTSHSFPPNAKDLPPKSHPHLVFHSIGGTCVLRNSLMWTALPAYIDFTLGGSRWLSFTLSFRTRSSPCNCSSILSVSAFAAVANSLAAST